MAILKQVAALPVRQANNGVLEVLLVTSRDTGRWVVPKGWSSRRLDDASAAAREAYQEAGAISENPIGNYRYVKRGQDASRLVEVSVYLLVVDRLKGRWPEKEQRSRTWFTVPAAAQQVKEPKLRALISALNHSAVL